MALTESGDISISVSSETECFWSFPRTEPANSWDILMQDKIGDVILLTSQDNVSFRRIREELLHSTRRQRRGVAKSVCTTNCSLGHRSHVAQVVYVLAIQDQHVQQWNSQGQDCSINEYWLVY